MQSKNSHHIWLELNSYYIRRIKKKKKITWNENYQEAVDNKPRFHASATRFYDSVFPLGATVYTLYTIQFIDALRGLLACNN